MDKLFYSKQEVIEYLWLYSRYYSQRLFECEELFQEKKGYASITMLFSVLENIMKLSTDDYDSSLYDVAKKLNEQSIITDEEYKFVSTNKHSVRKIRNLFAHANLFAVNIVNIENNNEILYPLTEEDSCLLLYNKLSGIIFNLIFKIISREFIDEVKNNINIDLSKQLLTLKLDIKTLTLNEMEALKGIPVNSVAKLDIPYNKKLKILDEAPDVNVYASILENLIK